MDRNVRTIAGIYLRLSLLFIAVGFITRIILLFNPSTTETAFSVGQWIGIFLFGIINDACVITIAFIGLYLFLLSISSWKFTKPWNYICLALLFAGLIYLTCFNTVFDEYGAAAPKIATGIMLFWAISFAVRNFLPSFRTTWTVIWFYIIAFLYVGGTFFNVIAEVAFWNEFGVRYNFIAVDYLVYTNEVVGNIMESYPMGLILSCWALVSIIVEFFLFRHTMGALSSLSQGWRWKAICSPSYIVAFVLSLVIIGWMRPLQSSANTFYNELQANGLNKFYDAFMKNELQYTRFYSTIPSNEAQEILAEIYRTGNDNIAVADSIVRESPNIILITMESMSADFMERFGNEKHLTPTLDSLYLHSLAFDSIFATGNRTVRGLEALTLSLPPCPGQSIVKQANNTGLFSTGSLLRDNGYSTTFFYGGNAYFDNMEEFFGGNGYIIVDNKSYTPEDITFKNIWGVCDEDSYRKALNYLDTLKTKETGPFFAHIMTVSNHRPFTYPEGRITLQEHYRPRDAGVLYSDYALGQFIKQASEKEWFENTIFVITADHCASSAGSTEIPLDKYHIPALIYSPKLIEPQQVTKVASQIDIMPTLFSTIGVDYDHKFYGRNILADNFRQRAFIATYQDLGYLDGGVLTILSPGRRIRQYKRTPTTDNPFMLTVKQDIDSTLANRAIAFYQESKPIVAGS